MASNTKIDMIAVPDESTSCVFPCTANSILFATMIYRQSFFLLNCKACVYNISECIVSVLHTIGGNELLIPFLNLFEIK